MNPARRATLILLAGTLLPAWGEASDPAAFVSEIYRRASAGKGDSGGQFLWLTRKARREAFTARTSGLWSRAEAATPKGDAGPMEFDPVTASQDPSLERATVRVETSGPDRATVAATLVGPGYKPPGNVVRYDLVREGGAWRIDDIRGAIDAEPWSVRAILQASLKR